MPRRELNNPFDRLSLASAADAMISSVDSEEVERLRAERDALSRTIGQALLPGDDGAFHFGEFALSPTGLVVGERVEYDAWELLGARLRSLESALTWWIGDWAALANRLWSISYDEMAERFGYDPDTLMGYASVCRAIRPELRHAQASFSHHRLLQGRSDDEISVWLERCVNEGWSVSQLRAALSPKRLASTVVDTHQTYVERVTKKARRERWSKEEREAIAQMYETLAQRLRQP